MTFRQILGWLLLGSVIIYIGKNPDAAAATAEDWGDAIGKVFTNIGRFFVKLTT